MAYTNKTPHYDLPQWIATDKPSYLSDQNQAYLDIDTAIFDAKTTAESSGSVANSALGAASAAQTAAESANSAAVESNKMATEAKTSATQAITSATEANTAATNAATAAQTAQTTADSAKSTAESAQSAASAAAGSASTAQTRANEAYTLAQGASNTANSLSNVVTVSSNQSSSHFGAIAIYDPYSRQVLVPFQGTKTSNADGTNAAFVNFSAFIRPGNPFNLTLNKVYSGNQNNNFSIGFASTTLGGAMAIANINYSDIQLLYDGSTTNVTFSASSSITYRQISINTRFTFNIN